MLRNECCVGFRKAGVSKAFCEKLYPLFECRSIDEVIQQLSIVDEQWKQSHVSRGGAWASRPSGVDSLRYRLQLLHNKDQMMIIR